MHHLPLTHRQLAPSQSNINGDGIGNENIITGGNNPSNGSNLSINPSNRSTNTFQPTFNQGGFISIG